MSSWAYPPPGLLHSVAGPASGSLAVRERDQRAGIDYPLRENQRMAFPPHSLTPSELAALREAERQGVFLAYRDGSGDLRLMPLEGVGRATIGRVEENDLALGWDPEVSRTHAQLELVGGDWTLIDDGLSRNGSFVNGDRVVGRKRLADGDTLGLGRTSIVFRAPGRAAESTAVADAAALVRLTSSERRVLVALCRPI